jgi:tetratricopeptide (TPR) repeat protein
MKTLRYTVALLAFAPAAYAPAAYAQNPGAFLAAEFAAHEGDVAYAAARMAEALDADPSSAELRNDAFVLDMLARTPQAAELARTVPDNPIAALLLATLAARAGDWQKAELGFAELPHDPLTDAMRPLLMAWAQEAQGLADRAMDTLQPALTNGKLGSIGLLHAALIADAGHRDGLAQRLYNDLAHAQTQPSLQFAQIYSSWQARSGDMAGARATLDSAIRNAPELEIAKPGLMAALAQAAAPNATLGMARAYVEVAAELRGHNGHDVADLLVQLALELAPDLTDARLLASDIASTQKQPHLAASYLAGIAPADPLWPVIQLRLANLYERDNRPEEASALLKTLAERFPSRPEPLAQLGDTLTDQKHLPEAVTAYDQAIALLRHPAASDWVVFFARGSVLERLHEWPRAEADMNRALELSPDQPYVLNFLGYSLAERNMDLPLAQDMIQKALAAKPNDGAIVDSLGWVKLRLGDTKEALRLLEKAAELEPDDPSITGHLGDAYWDAGRHVEAEDQWRRALVLKPEPDEQARIEGRLKNLK